jgi:hypothetical protein
MKKNVSLIFLVCEIAAIIILHAVKMNHQTQSQNTMVDANVSAVTVPQVQVKHYTLLSIK